MKQQQSKRDQFYGQMMAAAGFLGNAAQTAVDSDFAGCGIHINLLHHLRRAEECIAQARLMLGVPNPKTPSVLVMTSPCVN
jgi:hypothetical protein